MPQSLGPRSEHSLAKPRRHGTSTGFALLHPLPICGLTIPQPSLFTQLTVLPSFQGFDSGIYSIIISDKRFINYLNVRGARAGVMASMGMSHRLRLFVLFLTVAVNLGNVLGNFFVAWWFIWFLGRCRAFALGTVILLIGVALQAAAVRFGMIVVGRIISGIGTAM